jgi:hypothetical protein
MSSPDIQDEALFILMLHEGPPGEERFPNHEQLDATESPLLATDSDSSFIRDDKRIEEPGICPSDENLPLIERLVRYVAVQSSARPFKI